MAESTAMAVVGYFWVTEGEDNKKSPRRAKARVSEVDVIVIAIVCLLRTRRRAIARVSTRQLRQHQPPSPGRDSAMTMTWVVPVRRGSGPTHSPSRAGQGCLASPHTS